MGTQDSNTQPQSPLHHKFNAVEARIDAHVFGSGPMAQSLAIIEKMRAEGATDHEIDTTLHKKKLPSVVDVGRKSVRHLPSWWWLNRRKRSLENKISKRTKRN